MRNLYAGLPSGAQKEEQLVEWLSHPGLRIERIVSTGQASPPGFWYEQPQAEWVLLLQGEARLAFADEPAPRLFFTNSGSRSDISAIVRRRARAGGGSMAGSRGAVRPGAG
jgi:cupin 2 domain-containing protein